MQLQGIAQNPSGVFPFATWYFWANEIETLLSYMEQVELENVEVFYLAESVIDEGGNCVAEIGWHWWICFAGCLPEGDGIQAARGPYLSEQGARLAAYVEQMEFEST